MRMAWVDATNKDVLEILNYCKSRVILKFFDKIGNFPPSHLPHSHLPHSLFPPPTSHMQDCPREYQPEAMMRMAWFDATNKDVLEILCQIMALTGLYLKSRASIWP